MTCATMPSLAGHPMTDVLRLSAFATRPLDMGGPRFVKARAAGIAANRELDEERTERRPPDDLDLVERCIAGEQRAWNDLVEKYARLVYSIPRRYGFCEADADDVFQTVFSIVIKSLPKLRDHARISSWLITTTRRECWRKGRGRSPHVEMPESVVDPHESPEMDVQRLERRQMVREAMQQLCWRERALLEALFMQTRPRSYEDISRELEIPVGSIGPTRARAFRKLEEILRSMGAADTE